MRFFPSLIGLCLAAGAFAQQSTFAGTKSDVIKTSTQSPTGMGMMPFFQLMVALGVVLLVLKFVLPKFVTKLNKRLVTGSGSGIKVEESAAFAGGNLYIVNARGKTLLLSVATSGVNCLADLTEPQAKPEGPTFIEILEQASAQPEEVELLPVPEAIAPAEDMLLEDVHRLLEGARTRREIPDLPEEAVVEEVTFKTRLPENTKPLPPVNPEPQPWQPKHIRREPGQEVEEALRRLNRLSS
jgi:hypothetical protein